ncbi:hypothetical protein DL89DRAFT_312026 [Linderina pennispora]|uniref:RTA1-domain-containing protein n=1 Tax=Linderina pennispora TaxID=61395 RepID=A0A1Y1WGC7_9FUNG|nr:uncharacterized protein DL89DRAFT_312026 [Linderina pennispora]ORX72194.1 hypothetical protein DL89DRAFT_312026 [Linderina pennispora]
MTDVSFGTAVSIPQYYPSKGAAYGVASLFFVLGLILLFEGRRAQKHRLTCIGVLIAMMLGGAFVARGIFIKNQMRDAKSFTTFSVLNSIAPNFINLVNCLLLVNMLKSLVHGPSRKAIIGFRVFAIVMSVTFSALSGAGSGLMQDTASLDQLKTASNLLKASIAGQVANNAVVVLSTNFFLAKYAEARTKPEWYANICIGGFLILLRNIFKLVTMFCPQVTFMVTNEAAWYCVDPMLSMLVLLTWVVLDMPRRCQPPVQSAQYQQQTDTNPKS